MTRHHHSPHSPIDSAADRPVDRSADRPVDRSADRSGDSPNAGDQSLVKFLRQHRPVAPAPDPDLEGKILAALTGSLGNSVADPGSSSSPTGLSTPAPTPAAVVPLTPRRTKPWKRWVVPPAIAATVLAAWMGVQGQIAQRRQAEAQQLAQLELFLEETWGATLYDSSLDGGFNSTTDPANEGLGLDLWTESLD